MRSQRSDEEAELESEASGGGHRHGLLKLALLGGAAALLVKQDVRNKLLDLLFGAEEEFNYSSLTEPPEPPTDHSPSEPWVITSEPVSEPPEPPAGDSPSEPWARASEPVSEPPEPPAGDSRSEPWARASQAEHQPAEEHEPAEEEPTQSAQAEARSDPAAEQPPSPPRFTAIAPSPAAWRAAEAEGDRDLASDAGGETPESGGQAAGEERHSNGGVDGPRIGERRFDADPPQAAVPPSPPPGWWAPSEPGLEPPES
jgi:hypothetical protein